MIPDSATNAATRTVPIIPVVASVPAARTAPQPARLSLAPGPAAPAPARPAAAAPAAPVTPAPRPAVAAAPPSAHAYFEWFQSCRCGHSSAWHGGAFGEAWRSGQQVQGACEASASERTAQRCPCSHFAAGG